MVLNWASKTHIVCEFFKVFKMFGPEPIKVDKLGDLGDWFKAGSIQSEIMSSFSIKELE